MFLSVSLTSILVTVVSTLAYILLGLLLILIVLVFVVWLFLTFAPTFGAKPDKESLARIKASPNFNGRKFFNLTTTNASTINLGTVSESLSYPSANKDNESQNNHLLLNYLFPPKGKNPSEPITTLPLNLIKRSDSIDSKTFSKGIDSKTVGKGNIKTGNQTTLKDGEFVWLGHSTVLFRLAGLTLITDPVFHRASPVPLGGKPFAMTNNPTTADLPFIDIALISHDHYDHLDHKAIKQMHEQVGHFYVPLGVKAHLVRWGVAETKITEFDWYDSITVNGDSDSNHNGKDEDTNNKDKVTMTFTPARHFSGRGITNHRTTLWGGWAVQGDNLKVFFSGDGGYSTEFAKIGERFGGFDMAFIEDGAYNERWQDVHMLPEQSAQAGIDVGARVVLPIHWGKFDLSTHNWREPVRRIKTALEQHNKQVSSEQSDKVNNQPVTVATPRIGQVFDLNNLPTKAWWEDEPA